MKLTQKRERVIEGIRLVWDSLDSHLDYTSKDLDKICECTHHVSCGNRKFHTQCVREYVEVIKILAEQL